MKAMLGFLIAWTALAAGVFAQQLSPHRVPASVNESFHSKFKGVSKVEWKLKSDQNYEAEFKLKGVEVAAKFDQRGKWLETETAIEKSELTTDIRAKISTDFKGYKIIETQKVERADDKPILFEVHLDNAEEILKLQFESKGTVFSKSSKRKLRTNAPNTSFQVSRDCVSLIKSYSFRLSLLARPRELNRSNWFHPAG